MVAKTAPPKKTSKKKLAVKKTPIKELGVTPQKEDAVKGGGNPTWQKNCTLG